MKIGKIFEKSMQLLRRTLFLWGESRGILACMSINKSPHYIVGVSDGAKMESLSSSKRYTETPLLFLIPASIASGCSSQRGLYSF